MKTVEFFYFTWILIGLFNFCIHFSESVDSITINKCDSDSFNSKEEIETFNKTFGHFRGSWVHDFNFNYSFNGLKNRCTVKTVHFQFNSTSTSEANSTLASMVENENTVINALPEFWSHGFFSYKPYFYINPENYCVKKLSRDILTVEICEAASNSTSNANSNSTGPNFPPILQKCCQMGLSLTIDKTQNVTCEYSKDPPWKPKNFMENMDIYPNYNASIPCKPFYYILPHQLAPQIQRDKNAAIKFKDVRVLADGGVETKDSGNHQWKTLEKNNYCIDVFHAQLTVNKSAEEIPADRFMIYHCVSKISESRKIKDIIYTATCLISCVVLLIIVIVYVLVWSQQKIPGWTKCAFSLAMFLWFLFTGVRIWYKEDDFCIFLAVSAHFFRISVYSWMLLLNFDLWSTMRSMTAHSQRSKGRTRFFCYCCVALTIPTIVVSISLIIENHFSLFDDSVIRPQYGRERCSLDHTAVKAYAIYPTIILFLPNFIFIFLTLKIVLNLKKGLQGENSRVIAAQSNNKTEMKLCLKLFVIMGISWIFEIVSGLTDTDEVSWYWMITDIYNIAQPFFLFWLFICKKEIREKLSHKYSIFKAGFKWMDAHAPCCCSAARTATVSRSYTGRSESNPTRSTTFKSSARSSTQCVSFKSAADSRG